MTLLSDNVIFYLTTKPTCHVIWKPAMHDHQKSFQHCPTAHIFGPCIHHVKFVAALQPQFYIFYDSLLALLQVQVFFYMTPALLFWFIVVSSVFHLFSFLDRSSPIPTMPTKFHHHLQA